MVNRILLFIRNRWHPLRELRKLTAFQWFQKRFDFTIYKQLPGIRLQMAMKLLRDAGWLAIDLEPAVRDAFSLVLEVAKPEVFWDVGANLGFYSWFVQQYPTIRRVVLFEPDPTNFGLITKTIQKNRVSNCELMNVALSDQVGEALFLVDRASGTTGSLSSVSSRDNPSSLQHGYRLGETINSRTTTIDGAISEGLPAPDLIKIDVEGAESLVLAGAENCLVRYQPALIIETSNAKLLLQLSDRGYRNFRVDGGNWLCIFPKPGLELDALVKAFEGQELLKC
jgi:FkbM family methyltransferase